MNSAPALRLDTVPHVMSQHGGLVRATLFYMALGKSVHQLIQTISEASNLQLKNSFSGIN